MNKTSMMIFVSLAIALALAVASPAATYLGRLFYTALTFICVWVFLALVDCVGTWFKSVQESSKATKSLSKFHVPK